MCPESLLEICLVGFLDTLPWILVFLDPISCGSSRGDIPCEGNQQKGANFQLHHQVAQGV